MKGMVSVAPPFMPGVPPPRRGLGRAGFSWVMSLVLHVAAIGAVGEWALYSLRHAEPPEPPRAVARAEPKGLPPMAEISLASDEPDDPVGTVPLRPGGPTTPRVDTGRDGRGGDVTVAHAATHLSDVDERLTFARGTLNRLDRDQAARLRTQATRAAWEDRRSTTHPMDLAFLSSSDLARLERRALADRDPSRGVLASRFASSPGAAPGLAPEVGDELAGLAGSARQGSVTAAPGSGVRDGVPGVDHRTSAAVASARPAVTQAPVSVEALVRARPRDNVDSEQELTSKVESLVHASTAGGAVAKSGVGGAGGGDAPGALGIRGAGSHPTPLGDGSSDWFDLSSNDPRVVAYFRRFHAKVDPLWANAFPMSALLDLKQGTVILDITIAANGTAEVAWPPERPSGVDEFDRNCAAAVRRASPFDPIPRELGLSRLHVRAPFVARNPIVH
jgi:TonB family protein